jgi:peroxiredoxin
MAGGTTYFIAYLGADDHLPRRLVRGFDSRSSSLPMAGTETIDYLSLTTDPELSDDAFLLATPEGYTEERFPDQVRIPANLPGSISVPTPGSEGDGEGGTPEPGGDGSVIATASSFVPTAGVAREMALEFDLKDDQGKPIRLSDLRGKLVLVLFWSSWSPWASDLARELRPIREANPDLQVLVLAVRERSPETMRQRFDALRLPATLLAGADDVAARYEVGAVPSLVLVGTQGEILLRHSGFDPQHSPITELRSLIANQ